MIIRNIGNSLSHILPELIGQDISNVFDLTRPLVEFKFASVRPNIKHFTMKYCIRRINAVLANDSVKGQYFHKRVAYVPFTCRVYLNFICETMKAASFSP